MFIDLLLVATTARVVDVVAFLFHGLRCNLSQIFVMLDIKVATKMFRANKSEEDHIGINAAPGDVSIGRYAQVPSKTYMKIQTTLPYLYLGTTVPSSLVIGVNGKRSPIVASMVLDAELAKLPSW